MPGRRKHTNPALILLCILLCLVCGIVFTQSSANPLPDELEHKPDTIVADKGSAPAFSSEEEDTFTSSEITPTQEPPEENSPGEESPGEESPEEESPAPAEPTDTPAPTEAPKEPEKKTVYEVSPEAEKGVWTASGSSWMFLVDGVPYTGWLNDTDGKRYFFTKKGILYTGWLNRGGKRYYFDLDGILQTGTQVIDGETYEFLEDGSLKGYTPPAKEEDSEKTSDQNTAKETSKEKKGYVALTFDDGPSSFTDRLLDCLETNKVKATFFMVGEEVASFPEEVKRMEALGCELGNHSYTHQDLTELDSAGIADEISRTDALIAEQAGHGADVVRPPYGAINDTVSSAITVPMILWSIDTLDWETQDPQEIVKAAMDEVTDGSVILMHDIFSTSVDAAEILIPRLIEEGYELVTIHELAEKHGIELHPGVAYGAME